MRRDEMRFPALRDAAACMSAARACAAHGLEDFQGNRARAPSSRGYSFYRGHVQIYASCDLCVGVRNSVPLHPSQSFIMSRATELGQLGFLVSGLQCVTLAV